MTIKMPHEKLYFSLRQVAEMVEVPPEEIRKWEDWVPDLSPTRNRAGHRQFNEKDIRLIYQLKELFVNKQLDREAALDSLQNNRASIIDARQLKMRQILGEAKLEVREILSLLADSPAPSD